MLPPECPKLVRVYLAVTHRCPLQCRHCYAATASTACPEMTFREIEKIVREIIPRLKRAGAQGIVEYPLNKVIY